MNYYDVAFSVKDKDGNEIDKGVNLYVGETEPDTSGKNAVTLKKDYPEGHTVDYNVTPISDADAQSRFQAPNAG